ncbi:MAG TPA: hypothetical protein VJ780_07295 [Flavobacterium sp.]|nr:hypothetical protein [Flavobacterium sp.]
MKNWKTTLAGLIAGLPVAIDAIIQAYTAGYFTDKSGWQLVASLAFIVLGAVLRDKKIYPQKIGGSNPPPVKDEK